MQWFRPPYGDQTTSTWTAVVSLGLIPVMWTAEARDWLDVPESERVASACCITTPGGILLCHDGFPNNRDGVLDAVPPPPFDRGDLARAILRNYRERGFQATSLGAAAEDGTLVGRPWLNRG
jgi:peptidoglycan/xylan/chitin deacetylase (PgdA/CDA1 family)